jgi:hypothetical protein
MSLQLNRQPAEERCARQNRATRRLAEVRERMWFRVAELNALSQSDSLTTDDREAARAECDRLLSKIEAVTARLGQHWETRPGPLDGAGANTPARGYITIRTVTAKRAWLGEKGESQREMMRTIEKRRSGVLS